MKEIISIVLTGGPCAGKSNSIVEVKSFLSNLGYKVIIIPEIATETRANGFINSNVELTQTTFQKIIFETQLFKENLYKKIILEDSDETDVIMIIDRGLMDNKIYLSGEEFCKLKTLHGLTDELIFKRYTAVFHLVSTAVGKPEFYNKDSNQYRLSDCENARKLELKCIQVWKEHNNFHIINVEENFETKLEKLKAAILKVLNKCQH